jgi:hypothetical protein
MVGPTIPARVLDELRRARRPLDDDELARRLGVSPRQTINQVCRGLERSGRLRRYAGSAGKIVNDLGRAVPASNPLAAPLTAAPGQDVHQQARASGGQPGRAAAWPGHLITASGLSQLGFQPLGLRVTSLEVDLPSGRGCEWTTIGQVPPSPRLYARSPWRTIIRSEWPTSGSPSTCGWSPRAGYGTAVARAAASAMDGHDMPASPASESTFSSPSNSAQDV